MTLINLPFDIYYDLAYTQYTRVYIHDIILNIYYKFHCCMKVVYIAEVVNMTILLGSNEEK